MLGEGWIDGVQLNAQYRPDSHLAAAVAEDERHHGHDQKDHEENLGDACSPSGNATKTEDRCDQRNDQKNNGVMQHGGLLC